MEITTTTTQTVAVNQNVLFTDTPVSGSKCIVHRSGSGNVKLRGLTNQCNARFLVYFNGNIAAVSTGAQISLSITIDGDPVGGATMISTPADAAAFNNVSAQVYIDVPRGCCSTIAVENTSSQAVAVANSNLIVTRVA